MADGEITISELELSEELLADMVIPVETSTDTKSATLQQLKSWLGTSLPIGSFFLQLEKLMTRDLHCLMEKHYQQRERMRSFI